MPQVSGSLASGWALDDSMGPRPEVLAPTPGAVLPA